MRRKIAVPLIILLIAIMVGCATTGSYKANVYNTMQTIAETYNASMGIFLDLYKAGQISEADYEKGKALFIKGYDAFQEAVAMIVLFEKGQASEGDVDSAIDKIKELNAKLKEYLAEQIKKKGAA